jgi:hypothetical protein
MGIGQKYTPGGSEQKLTSSKFKQVQIQAFPESPCGSISVSGETRWFTIIYKENVTDITLRGLKDVGYGHYVNMSEPS